MRYADKTSFSFDTLNAYNLGGARRTNFAKFFKAYEISNGVPKLFFPNWNDDKDELIFYDYFQWEIAFSRLCRYFRHKYFLHMICLHLLIRVYPLS